MLAFSLRVRPALAARTLRVLLFPIVGLATMRAHGYDGSSFLRHHRGLLVEVDRRLDANPDGEEQRKWLGRAPRF